MRVALLFFGCFALVTSVQAAENNSLDYCARLAQLGGNQMNLMAICQQAEAQAQDQAQNLSASPTQKQKCEKATQQAQAGKQFYLSCLLQSQ